MMMNDSEIRQALISKELEIIGVEDAHIQPCSVDLTLDDTMVEFCGCEYVDITKETPSTRTRTGLKYIELGPGEFVLLQTHEYLKLPGDICATCTGRSSIGRLGLTVHVTAGFIDPGFEGTLTLEVKNVSKNTYKIPWGIRICQLLFFRINNPRQTYATKNGSGKYQGQNMPTPSRIFEDTECEYIGVE